MNISRILSLPQKLTMAPHQSQQNSRRNIIAVASGKGGVGKTWLSISLAHALARSGVKTLLFDGDLGLANVDIQLGLVTPYDLGSVMTGRVPLTGAIVPCPECGIDVIAGRSGSGSLANIPLSRLQMIFDDLKLLSTQYDKVVIDLGAGVEKAVRLFAGNAGTLLVVCTDEPTSLTDAYALIKMMTRENPDVDIRVVINSANTYREGERTYATLLKACQGFLKISPPCAGIVRRDTRVRDSIRAQSSILNSYPTADAAGDVLKIAEGLK